METAIIVLDGFTLNPGDLSWAPLQALGKVRVYPRSSPEEGIERAQGAAFILVNKFKVDETFLATQPDLRYIGITATGYNNIDLAAACKRGICVTNVKGYGTHSVAQHVFAMLLALINKPESHHQSVVQGRWSAQPDFCYWLAPMHELAGKKLGIYGLGNIGQAVARIGLAFGMDVLAYHKHPERDAMPGVRFVTLEELFEQSHVLSLHAPLSEQNAGFVQAALLERMPAGSYLINTSRGGLINEADLHFALTRGPLAGAALDVLAQEPPQPNHPLLHLPNCLVTPHMAWATRESRQRLLDEAVENMAAFMRGERRNVISN